MVVLTPQDESMSVNIFGCLSINVLIHPTIQLFVYLFLIYLVYLYLLIYLLYLLMYQSIYFSILSLCIDNM